MKTQAHLLHYMLWPRHDPSTLIFSHILQSMSWHHKIGHTLWKTLSTIFLIRLLLLSATSICSFLFVSFTISQRLHKPISSHIRRSTISISSLYHTLIVLWLKMILNIFYPQQTRPNFVCSQYSFIILSWVTTICLK